MWRVLSHADLHSCKQQAYLEWTLWRVPALSSWSWTFPAQTESCTGWTTPLRRRWACRSAPPRWSSPGRRWGSTPGSCRRTPLVECKWGSMRSSTGHRLPGRGGSRWSHTEAGCTECSGTESEPGVWPTVSWRTYRCPLRAGRATVVDLVESKLMAHVWPPCLFPAGSEALFSLQSKVQATCAVRLHTFIDLLPRSSKVSPWRHVLPETHLPARLGQWPDIPPSLILIRPSR